MAAAPRTDASGRTAPRVARVARVALRAHARRHRILLPLLAALLVVAGCASLLAGENHRTDGSAASFDAERRTVTGYVPYWDQQRAFAVVRENLRIFDEVSPMWYSLDEAGNVVLADDEHTTVDRDEVRFLQDRGIRVIPTVANLRNGEWTTETVQEVLHDPEKRTAHVRNIVDLAVRQGYDGMDVDYESLQAGDREVYSAFLRELGAALGAEGKVLTTSVHPKQSEPGPYEHNKAQNYRAIGKAADQVRVMTYDYHWDTSPPGPVAPVGWVDDVISWTVTQIPAEKVRLGVVLLGYDWVIGGNGSTVSYEQATARAREHDASISHVGPGHSPMFSYTDDRGREHEVWFEDARSVRPKLRLVEKYDLGGAFFWRLGGEDSRVWDLVGPKPDPTPGAGVTP